MVLLVEKISQFMNTANVSMKTFTTFMGIVAFIILFYFQSNSHIDNKDIHVSTKQLLDIHETRQNLRDRIEKLEWDLRQLEQLTERRHNNQKADIEGFNNSVNKYDANLVEIRKILFEAFVNTVTNEKKE